VRVFQLVLQTDQNRQNLFWPGKFKYPFCDPARQRTALQQKPVKKAVQCVRVGPWHKECNGIPCSDYDQYLSSSYLPL